MGKPLHILRLFGVCNKKDGIGSVKGRLGEHKHRGRRPVQGYYNCSGCVGFQLNGLIFVERYEC